MDCFNILSNNHPAPASTDTKLQHQSARKCTNALMLLQLLLQTRLLMKSSLLEKVIVEKLVGQKSKRPGLKMWRKRMTLHQERQWQRHWEYFRNRDRGRSIHVKFQKCQNSRLIRKSGVSENRAFIRKSEGLGKSGFYAWIVFLTINGNNIHCISKKITF